MKQRLDKELLSRKMVATRSQAENYIKLGLVRLNGRTVQKPGYMVSETDKLALEGEQYVSRAALKLASIAKQFSLDFRDKMVLDVGSSTGGFTDYALQHGARKVVAVDVGTDQLHPKLRTDKRVELHEKTDIRCVRSSGAKASPMATAGAHAQCKDTVVLQRLPDIVVADVSFVSLTKILPAIATLVNQDSVLVMMCKPQFEAGKSQINKGIVKNSAMRRAILKDFEAWLKQNAFVVLDKADSQVAGTKGNVERFYKIKKG